MAPIRPVTEDIILPEIGPVTEDIILPEIVHPSSSPQKGKKQEKKVVEKKVVEKKQEKIVIQEPVNVSSSSLNQANNLSTIQPEPQRNTYINTAPP